MWCPAPNPATPLHTVAPAIPFLKRNSRTLVYTGIPLCFAPSLRYTVTFTALPEFSMAAPFFSHAAQYRMAASFQGNEALHTQPRASARGAKNHLDARGRNCARAHRHVVRARATIPGSYQSAQEPLCLLSECVRLPLAT